MKIRNINPYISTSNKLLNRQNFCSQNSLITSNDDFSFYHRETTFIKSELSEDTINKLGTKIFQEYLASKRGLNGKLARFADKIQYSWAKLVNSKNGEFKNIENEDNREIAISLIERNLLPGYIKRLFDDHGNTFLYTESGDEFCSSGKGFKLYKSGIELDEEYREAFVQILEKANSYKEIQDSFKKVRSIVDY